jgi:hypothetical protein
MASNHPHGRPEEEMFIADQNQAQQNVPIVGPLRINKTHSNSSSPAPQAHTPPPSSFQGASTSNPPVAPLPYPDDRPRPVGGGSYAAQYPPPTSTPEGGRRRGDSNTMPFGTGSSPRTHFSANDPNRPTVAGYGHAPPRVGTASPAQSNDSRDSGRKASEGAPTAASYGDYQKQSWPAPSSGSATPQAVSSLKTGSGLSRLDSTASIMTTRATRGSPPPPETPIIPPPTDDIEARYAAAGFGRPTPAASAPSAAAQQRTAQYTTSAQSTPQPSTTAYQVPESRTAASPPVQSPPPGTSLTALPPVRPSEHALEQDFSRMNVHDEPPPSYASIEPPAAASQSYPNEKGRPANAPANLAAVGLGGAAAAAAAAGSAAVAGAAVPNMNEHPAFHNDARSQHPLDQVHSPTQSSVAGPSQLQQEPQSAVSTASTIAPLQVPASPPPLPEGWMAHLDEKSGQYYYIHLPTQSTQWEFPKGPNPLNLNEPLSPTGTFIGSPVTSTFTKPLQSPGFAPQSATFRPDGYFSMASIASPTAAGFTAAPPTAGLDIFNVQPSNGVYFGPYLRYTNMDLEQGLWLGSILLISNTGQPPTIHIHQSVDLSPNPGQLKAIPIYSHQRWLFYRYDISVPMEEQGAKWTYAITSHLGCTRYEFLVAGRHETSWRFIAHSGNDFAMNVNANERNKLGGVGFMWKDILQKHIECNGFHCQLGVGDQIFADRMWKEIPLLKEWTSISGKQNRKGAEWTTKHEDDVTHAYFHYYTSHFDQPHLREAWAQIPHVLTLDHHDM